MKCFAMTALQCSHGAAFVLKYHNTQPNSYSLMNPTNASWDSALVDLDERRWQGLARIWACTIRQIQRPSFDRRMRLQAPAQRPPIPARVTFRALPLANASGCQTETNTPLGRVPVLKVSKTHLYTLNAGYSTPAQMFMSACHRV